MNFKKLGFIIACAVLVYGCKKDLGAPPEIKLNQLKSTYYGIALEFEVVDEDFEYSKLYLNGNFYKRYSSSYVVDTIKGVLPFNSYNIRIEAFDERGNIRHKEYPFTFAPPPLTYWNGFCTWTVEDVNFCWTPLAGAEWFELQISRSSYEWDLNLVLDTLISDTCFTFRFNERGGFYWRVRGLKGSIQGEWSEILYLKVVDLTAPGLKEPINDSCWKNEIVNFSWFEKECADQYEIHLSSDSLFISVILDSITSGTSISWPSENRLGRFYWRVRAGKGSTWTPWSETGTFDIIEVPSPPQVYNPADGSMFWNSEYIRFSWNSVSGAEGYDLEVFKPGYGSIISVYTQYNYYNWTPGYSNTGELKARVRARRGTIYTLWSLEVTFTSLDSKPVVLSPPDNYLHWNAETLIFGWRHVPMADSYRIQVSEFSDFRNYLIDKAVTDTQFRWLPLSFNGKFYWRVRAEKINATGFFSDVLSFSLCPFEISSYAAYGLEDFYKSGNLIYLVSNSYAGLLSQGALSVVNFSNPQSPVSIANYSENGSFSTKYVSVSVNGNYIFIADSIWGLKVFEFSGNQIRKVSYLEFYPSSTFSVFASGNFLYVIHGGPSYRTLTKFDITDPNNLRVVGSVDISYAISVFVSGNYAYVSRGQSGITIVDVRNMSIQTTLDTPGYATNSYVWSNYLLVADGSNGLVVVDVSNPQSPSIVGTYSGINVKSVYGYDGAVLTTGTNNFISIIGLSNPQVPNLLGFYRPNRNGIKIVSNGNYAFTSTEDYIYVLRLK
uniref:Fibronectin type-III domain-containing protein n=1 Tax=candidate division WOR-3 bacterium TaxID=2052148 RepID=A0A7V3ZYC9_UNCW3